MSADGVSQARQSMHAPGASMYWLEPVQILHLLGEGIICPNDYHSRFIASDVEAFLDYLFMIGDLEQSEHEMLLVEYTMELAE